MTQLSPPPEDDMKQNPNTNYQFGPQPGQEEDTWEDIPEEGSGSEDSQRISDKKLRSRLVTPLPSPVRRRKLKTASIGTNNYRRTASAPPTPKRKPPQQRPEIPTDEIIDGAVEGALFTGRYTLDIFKSSIRLMRIPLRLLLFTLLLSLCMRHTAHYLQRAVTPFCFLPFVNRMTMCVMLLHPSTDKVDPWQKLLESQTKAFDELLDSSAGSSGLSLEVKKAEMATADLVTLVQYSDLTSKDLLVSSLKGFIYDAKKTGRGLQKLSAKLGGAVDNILAVNTYAWHTIEEANAKKPSAFASLSPWAKDPKAVVASTFTDAMNVLDANLKRLILEAESNLANLNTLEEHVESLRDMIARENKDVSQEEVLSSFFAILFKGARSSKIYADNLKVLKELGSFRKKALLHVTAALETLRAMSDDMEDLRERAATPELVGPSIPIEVHIQSIQHGIERLQEGREKAKRLEAAAVRRILEIGQEDDD